MRPVVSSTAYFTVERSVTPAMRSSSINSSTVKRFFTISRVKIFPSWITMLGLLHKSARNRMLFTVSTDRIADKHNKVKIGIIPIIKGIPKSCIGTAARSAIIRESTSSEGSNSPICRFPMRRIPRIINRYKIIVRTTAVIMPSPPLIVPFFAIACPVIYKICNQKIQRSGKPDL